MKNRPLPTMLVVCAVLLPLACSKSESPAVQPATETRNVQAPVVQEEATPPGKKESEAPEQTGIASFEDDNPMISQLKYAIAVMTIVEQNVDDCEKAVNLVKAFHEQHKARLDEIKAKVDAMQKNATPKMMMQFGLEAQKYSTEIAQKQPVMLQFQRNCLEQYAMIREAMEAAQKAGAGR